MGHSEKDYQDLSILITKKILKQLTKDEGARLDTWIKESKANKELHEKLVSASSWEQRKHFLNKFDIEDAWAKINIAITEDKEIVTKIWHLHPINMVASLIVLIAISCFSILIFNRMDNQNFNSVVNSAKPGNAKAILTLSDGKDFQLNMADTTIQTYDKQLRINNESISFLSKNKKNTIKKTEGYNTLKTPKGGEYKIILEDSSIVWLNASSKLTFPNSFGKNSREVVLEGEGYFDVTHDSLRPFIVKFKGKEIKVLGTSFNIRSYKDDLNEYVTLAKGRIILKVNNTSYKMAPNQQAIIPDSNQNVIMKMVDSSIYTAWKDGQVVYNNAPLKEIVEDLQRWFDVGITYETKELKTFRFSLYMDRQDKFSTILEVLRSTGKIDFKTEKNEIIIIKK